MIERGRTAGGVLVLFAASALGATVVCAQVPASSQTNTINGVTSNWVDNGYYVVGSNTCLDALCIINGGVLSNGSGLVGYTTAASNNAAIVSGAGSVWTNHFDLYVGLTGRGNRLIITNHGAAYSGNAYMGFSLGGSNNMALVSDAGSHWSVSTNLYVGYFTSGNRLMVSNGGAVSDLAGALGFTNADGNVALIGDPGSVWSNGSFLYVGYCGAFNQLIVTNGGAVCSGEGYLGAARSGSNNTARIIGNGSAWKNANGFYVGSLGPWNNLVIRDGGTVSAINGFVGFAATSSNNMVSVADNGSVWSNSFSLVIGYAGPGNKLVVTNGAAVQDSSGALGYMTSSTQNSALIDGVNSVWSNDGFLYIGYSGALNRLTVTNGGTVFSGDCYLGALNSGSNNLVSVTGVGSIWRTTNTLYVGYLSGSNQLAIDDGGAVYDTEGYVGFHAASAGNTVSVAGGDSVWSHAANLYVGHFGSGNHLIVTNGATVRDVAGILGYANSSAGNTTFLGGPSALWSNASFLYVGYNGTFNQLIVTDGGAAFSGLGYIGAFNFSSNNTVAIDGTGSVWSVTNVLYVGFAGEGNALTILDGGRVSSANGIVGDDTMAAGNSVLVSGRGSIWSNRFDLTVGSGGSGNRLTITDGGAVHDSFGYVGYSTASSNNSVLVTGARSVWMNPGGGVMIGSAGRGNLLTVANGGMVVSGTGLVGSDFGTNNLAVVTGSGSTWSNSSFFYLGNGGSGNSLVVSNGGAVVAATGYLGYGGFSGGNDNTALISGVSSMWSNGNFTIGEQAFGNSLVISNGGSVFDTTANLGDTFTLGFSGSNNTVLVTGPGSLWNTVGALTIGNNGNGNRLATARGGLVRATNLIIGAPGTTNNQLRLANGVVEAGSITISAGNSLAGSGTITGTTLNDGAIDADLSDSPLTFVGPVKNNASLRASDGGAIEFYGAVLNLGTTNFTGGSAVFHGPFLSVQGTTNSWSFAGGAWQTGACWSLGVAPSPTNAAVLITNATSKTVTVDASSFSAAPRSMTNYSITVMGSGSSTNTLRVENTPVPFMAINMAVRTNGIMIISNAMVQIGLLGTGSFRVDGAMRVEGKGVLDTRDAETMIIGDAASGLLSINGGTVLAGPAVLRAAGSTGVVSGARSVWSNTSLTVGNCGLIITNGGQVFSRSSAALAGTNAVSTVTGRGSVWRVADGPQPGNFVVGSTSGGGNQLIIADGAAVHCGRAYLDVVGSGNDLVSVRGNGALWSVRSILTINFSGGPNDGVHIGPGGTVCAAGLLLGSAARGTNFVDITGGRLYVTNSDGSALFDVRGALVLNTGTATVDKLLIGTNNSTGWVRFPAGTLYSKSTAVTNHQPFGIGDGTNAANFHLLGGVHSFDDGLRVHSNATLSGCGTINAIVVVDAGGTVMADCSPFVFNGGVTNNGTLRASDGNVFEAYKAVVNNGIIELSNGGTTNFHGAFINNGTVVDSGSVPVTEISKSGSDRTAKAQSYTGDDLLLQPRDARTVDE